MSRISTLIKSTALTLFVHCSFGLAYSAGDGELNIVRTDTSSGGVVSGGPYTIHAIHGVSINPEPSISSGSSRKVTATFFPCADICPADLSNDGLVDAADLGILLAFWSNTEGFPQADLNSDGNIDGGDLGLLILNWGPCP